MKKHKISKKLFAVSFSILAIALASAYYCIYQMVDSTIQQLEDTSYDYLVSTTNIIEDKINASLKTDFEKTKNLAEAIVLHNGTLEYALREFNKNNEFYSTAFINTNGTGINHRNQKVNIKNLKVKETALTDEKASISSSYLSDDGDILILMQVPVYQNHKLSGALYCEIMVRHYYTNDLFAFQEGKGRTFIIDNTEGAWILRSPASDMLKINSAGLYETLQSTKNEASTLKALRQCILKRDTGVFKLKSAKNTILLCTTPLEEMEQWQIITVMPDDLYKSQISNIIQYGWIMFGITTLGFILVITIVALSVRRRSDKKIDTLTSNYEAELHAEKSLNQAILNTTYDFAIVVDLDTGICEVISFKTEKPLMKLPKTYEQAFQQYCHMIYLDDIDIIRERLSFSALKAGIGTNNKQILRYRIMLEKETKWYESRLVYHKTQGKQTVYLMHNDITRQMQEQIEFLKQKY